MNRRIYHVQIDPPFIATHAAIEVLRPVYWSVNIYDGPDEYERGLTRFTRSQRLALAVFWYQAEVNNGGHAQFFLNPTGVVWKDALAGLMRLRLATHVAVLREAVARIGGDPPLDHESREPLLDVRGLTFDDLDERFYALERGKSLCSALEQWMVAEPGDFAFEGLVEAP